jgi:hypothetical protein
MSVQMTIKPVRSKTDQIKVMKILRNQTVSIAADENNINTEKTSIRK